MFAPYVDMSLTKSESLLAEGNKAGLDVVTLAFVVSAVNVKGEPVCAPAWGGIGSIGRDRLANGTTLQSLARAIRKAGGGVIVSFEGANPTELALTCPTAAKLQAAYQVVVDRYQATSIDLDVEGDAVADKASITRRDQASYHIRVIRPTWSASATSGSRPFPCRGPARRRG